MAGIFIYGASGHGRVVAEIAEVCGYELLGFVDDDESKNELLGLPVLSFSEFLKKPTIVGLGIGANKTRERIYQKLQSQNLEIATLIHPSACISKRAKIGIGTVVMANVVINSSANIGTGAIINSASVIEHDCVIGDFVHISPNCAIAGASMVGTHTHLGIGSCVIQEISIGENCIIGAGSVVINEIPPNSKVVGNPAKRYL